MLLPPRLNGVKNRENTTNDKLDRVNVIRGDSLHTEEIREIISLCIIKFHLNSITKHEKG